MPLKQKMACLRLQFTSSTCDVLVSVRLLVASVSGRHARQTEGCHPKTSQSEHRLKSAWPAGPWHARSCFGPLCLCSALLRRLTNISAAYGLRCWIPALLWLRNAGVASKQSQYNSSRFLGCRPIAWCRIRKIYFSESAFHGGVAYPGHANEVTTVEPEHRHVCGRPLPK